LEKIGGLTGEEWLEYGSEREDSFLRFLNHFHNPLEPWIYAGLSGLGGSSSILWGQDETQSWSWQKVRSFLLEALTAEGQTTREQAFAKAFEGLGHLVHLVQDTASPPHARNDPHLAYTIENLVEQLARSSDPGEKVEFQAWLADPIFPDPSWQSLSLNGPAPIPIARLIDADRYGGPTPNPDVTVGTTIGLAEYTSANFFSEDRTFPETTWPMFRLPFPARSGAGEADYWIRLKGGEWVLRPYYVKLREGDTGYRLGTVSVLREYIQRYDLDPRQYGTMPALDENVYRDYAAKLIPRAVGYSTALLDYFFRGKLAVERVRVEPLGTAGEVRVAVRNDMTNERMTGTVRLYYDDPTGNARTPVRGSSTMWQPVQFDVDLAPDQLSEEFVLQTFDVPETARVAGRYLAVFQGRLGAEPEAVAAKLVEIAAPKTCRLCSGNGCSFWWFVPAPGAALTIEGIGTGYTGTLGAGSVNEDGDFLGEMTEVSLAFGGGSPLSVIAPTLSDSVASIFMLDYTTGDGGFLCLTPPTTTPLEHSYSGGSGLYVNYPE
jgi:hypothetical protein